ncbi:MAG: hypothetical protein IT178_14170 [Acidobacteria bacterium]|nr:hypothetical protein [Acidobacteriota bacterium]
MRHLVIAIAACAVSAGSAAAQNLGPRTLTPRSIACADLPVSTLPVTADTLTIAGTERADGRVTMATGDAAVIAAGTGKGLAVGQQFLVRRLDGGREAFRRGVSGFAGVRTAAVLTVSAVDERFAIARIDFACDTVSVGDYLEPYTMAPLPAVDAAGAPNFDDRAAVLFGTDLRVSFGDGDVLAIDRGTSHGVTPGARFAIYRDSRNGLPLTEIGEVVVTDIAEQTSRGVVTRVFDVIRSGDVAVRRTQVP